MKTRVENGLIKIFDLQRCIVDMPDQAVFNLKYLGLRD